MILIKNIQVKMLEDKYFSHLLVFFHPNCIGENMQLGYYIRSWNNHTTCPK